MKSRSLIAAIAFECAAALTACGASSHSRPQAPHPAAAALPPAAEPAMSPALRAKPDGDVVSVRGAPEGVVADEKTGVIAAAVRQPPGLVLLDERSHRPVRRLPLAGAARHLALAGDSVLVPAETSSSLLQVKLPAGIPVFAAHVGRQPHDAVALGDGRIATSDEFGGSVSVVRRQRVVATLPGFVQPAGVAVVRGKLGVVDVRSNNLTLFEARTLRRLGSIRAGSGPTHVVSTPDGELAVVDTRGDALRVFDVSPSLMLRQRIPLAGTPYGVAIDFRRDRLWVTLTATNRVVAVQLGHALARIVASAATIRQPNSVAVDRQTGRVVVAGASDPGAIQFLAPSGLARGR